MPWIALAPAIAAVVLSVGQGTVQLVVSIINAVLSFFATNTILNLGTQRETGTEISAFETYKSVAVGVLTITWVVAIVLIIVAVV